MMIKLNFQQPLLQSSMSRDTSAELEMKKHYQQLKTVVLLDNFVEAMMQLFIYLFSEII